MLTLGKFFRILITVIKLTLWQASHPVKIQVSSTSFKIRLPSLPQPSDLLSPLGLSGFFCLIIVVGPSEFVITPGKFFLILITMLALTLWHASSSRFLHFCPTSTQTRLLSLHKPTDLLSPSDL